MLIHLCRAALHPIRRTAAEAASHQQPLQQRTSSRPDYINKLFSRVCIAAFKPNCMNRPFSTVDCGRSVVTTACHLLFCLSFFLCRHWHPLCFGFESQRILFLFLHRGGFESCSLCQWNNRPWSTLAKWNNWPFRNNWTFDNRNNWTFEAASSLRWL